VADRGCGCGGDLPDLPVCPTCEGSGEAAAWHPTEPYMDLQACYTCRPDVPHVW